MKMKNKKIMQKSLIWKTYLIRNSIDLMKN